MKSILCTTIIFLFSCNQSNKNYFEEDKLEAEYVINVRLDNLSAYLSVDNESDTIYIFKYQDTVRTILKFPSDKKTTTKIKETVKYHLQLNNFYSNGANTLHGNKVTFYINHSGNRLDAKYNEIDGYKDVSLNFDSLINYLDNQSTDFRNFFPR